jgi:hypothetical protein
VRPPNTWDGGMSTPGIAAQAGRGTCGAGYCRLCGLRFALPCLASLPCGPCARPAQVQEQHTLLASPPFRPRTAASCPRAHAGQQRLSRPPPACAGRWQRPGRHACCRAAPNLSQATWPAACRILWVQTGNKYASIYIICPGPQQFRVCGWHSGIGCEPAAGGLRCTRRVRKRGEDWRGARRAAAHSRRRPRGLHCGRADGAETRLRGSGHVRRIAGRCRCAASRQQGAASQQQADWGCSFAQGHGRKRRQEAATEARRVAGLRRTKEVRALQQAPEVLPVCRRWSGPVGVPTGPGCRQGRACGVHQRARRPASTVAARGGSLGLKTKEGPWAAWDPWAARGPCWAATAPSRRNARQGSGPAR